jgi:hypothetical protein
MSGRLQATTALAALPSLVLEPLSGRPEADWQRAPAGKWTPAQIVEHLAIGMTWSAAKFVERQARPPMRRRPRRLIERIASAAILGVGWYPQGFRAPEGSRPAEHVAGTTAATNFRRGLAAWEALERELLPARRADLFVRHPRLGDLTLEEWLRFHVIHARHHARQIHARLAS